MSKRGRSSTWLTLFVGALLVVAFYNLRPVPLGTPRCASAPLVVVASNEKSGLLGEMAADFAKTGPSVDGQCVAVKVARKASGEAEEALARGWNDATDGPRPDVWSPASTSWVEILRAHRVGGDKSDLIPTSLPSLIQSPLIIAMPRPMAEDLSWPDRPIGCHDVLDLARDPRGWARHGHPECGPFRLGKTNPTVSTSGLHALLGTYYAATQLTADLTAADVRRPEVAQFVKDIEQSVEHYGNTAATFMQNLGTADANGDAMGYMSAIAVEEKQLFDYNRQAPRQVPLAAVYPSEGTLVADHPYVVLRAPWVDEAKRRAAALFLTYLEDPQRQERFRAEGFRDHEGRGGPDLVQRWGVLPAGPGTVLPAPAAATLDLFLDDDELAVWAFATTRFDIAPMGPVGPRRAELERSITGLLAAGGTRLYDTTVEAVQLVARSAEPRRISAVVVLTDGVNTNGRTDLETILRELRAATAETRVRTFTIAYGTEAGRSILQRIAEATRGASYDASNPASIETVFQEVVGNF